MTTCDSLGQVIYIHINQKDRHLNSGWKIVSQFWIKSFFNIENDQQIVKFGKEKPNMY